MELHRNKAQNNNSMGMEKWKCVWASVKGSDAMCCRMTKTQIVGMSLYQSIEGETGRITTQITFQLYGNQQFFTVDPLKALLGEAGLT